MAATKQGIQVEPKFISMAELSCNPLMAFIFDEVKGSKDRLMDILKMGAPAPSSSKCKGAHHPMCSTTYGCIGERRLLLPSKFATWLAESEYVLGTTISEENGQYRLDKRVAKIL